MQTHEINDALNFFENFVGTFACDQLPETPIPQCCGLVINTDPASEPGQHWVAVFITEQKAIYFDSFALPPLQQSILEFIEQQAPGGYSWNKTVLQAPVSVKCGQFCVAFLKAMLSGQSYGSFIQQFTRDTIVNDLLVDYFD